MTFVSSSPPLGMRFAKVGFLVSLRGYHFFVTFIKKYHQKRGVFGQTVNSVWHIFLRLFASF